MPGTSAPIEKIFTLVNNAWSDERERMNENTVRWSVWFDLLRIFEKINNNITLLKKINSSEKYLLIKRSTY